MNQRVQDIGTNRGFVGHRFNRPDALQGQDDDQHDQQLQQSHQKPHRPIKPLLHNPTHTECKHSGLHQRFKQPLLSEREGISEVVDKSIHASNYRCSEHLAGIEYAQSAIELVVS